VLQKTIILNPFDARAAAWDVARDITDKSTAKEVANILIPTPPHTHQPFFTEGAAALLSGVFQAVHYAAPGEWTLRQVLLILDDETRLRKVLANCPHTVGLIKKWIEVPEWPSVNATIASRVSDLEPVVAAWDRATYKISLQDWVDGEGVLVLGSSPSDESALNAVNRVVFARCSQLLLSKPKSTTRRTWVYFDEAQQLGKLEKLDELLRKGRDYGISVVLGLQDIEGWKHKYEEGPALSILGQCKNKAFLQVEGADTAEWAAKQIGEYEHIREKESYTYGDDKTSRTVAHERVTERAVLPSEISKLPTPDFKNGVGVAGYYIASRIGVFKSHAEPQCIRQFLPPANNGVPTNIRRPSEEQQFRPWDDDDTRQLLSRQRGPRPIASKTTLAASLPPSSSLIDEGADNPADVIDAEIVEAVRPPKRLSDVRRIRFSDES
jgi:Type IV secretion-system coupling protein DNA-binding domain